MSNLEGVFEFIIRTPNLSNFFKPAVHLAGNYIYLYEYMSMVFKLKDTFDDRPTASHPTPSHQTLAGALAVRFSTGPRREAVR